MTRIAFSYALLLLDASFYNLFVWSRLVLSSLVGYDVWRYCCGFHTATVYPLFSRLTTVLLRCGTWQFTVHCTERDVWSKTCCYRVYFVFRLSDFSTINRLNALLRYETENNMAHCTVRTG